jgi:hypothetical protein
MKKSRNDNKTDRKLPPPAKKTISKNNSVTLQSTFSNITNSIIEGMSFGTGSAIGHTFVNKVSNYLLTENKKPNCEEFLKKFEYCKNNHDTCEDLFNQYEDCRKHNLKN